MSAPINFAASQFLLSAPKQRDCPNDSGAEVAFAGRSNAGKSSAINYLANQTKLARTSKTPGRTQLINFFSLSAQQRLVDLPGYGFAKVPKAMKQQWDKNLAEYLQTRQSLKGLVVVMDIRHPLRDYDMQMLRWSEQSKLPVHLLLTKADKLKKGPAKSTLLAVERTVKEQSLGYEVSLQLFSALKRQGAGELKTVLNQWLAVTNDEEE